MSRARLPGSGKRKPSAPTPGGIVTIACDQCGACFERKAYRVARSTQEGRKAYCGPACAKAAFRANAGGVKGTGAMATPPRRSQIMPVSRAVREQSEINDAAPYRPRDGRDVDAAQVPRTRVQVVPVDKRGNQW